MLETVILIEIATGIEEEPLTIEEIGKIGMLVLDVGGQIEVVAPGMILSPLMIEDKGKDTLKVDLGLALVVLSRILKMTLFPNHMVTL